MQRRVLAIVERADDVVRRRQIRIAIELPAGERDEMRRVQPRVLGVDGDEHLHDVIFGQTIEDHRRHVERLLAELFDVAVQREQPVLAVDGAEDALSLRHLEEAEVRRRGAGWFELQRLVGGDDHRAGDRGQIARLAALLVILRELFDLLADDLALIRRFRWRRCGARADPS